MKKNKINSKDVEFLKKREKLEKKNRKLFWLAVMLFVIGTILAILFFGKRLEIFWGVTGAWFIFICMTILLLIVCIKNEIRRRIPDNLYVYFRANSLVREYLSVQFRAFGPVFIMIVLGLSFSIFVFLSKNLLIEILFEKTMIYSFLFFILFCSFFVSKISLKIVNKYLGKEKK